MQNEFDNFIKTFDIKIDHKLSLLTKDYGKVYEAAKYSLRSGGKRLRPFLAYKMGQVFDVKNQDAIENIGFALEMIHTYSLIHDDLPALDNDDIRRGKPSCHLQFDESTAILAGDALLTASFEVLASIEGVSAATIKKMIKKVAQFIGFSGMIYGQEIDLKMTKNINQQSYKIKEILTMHYDKTGKMFILCGLLPFYIFQEECNAEISDEDIFTYCKNLGLIFQIIDDIEDFKKGEDTPNNIVSSVGFVHAEEILQIAKKEAFEAIKNTDKNSILLEVMDLFINLK